MIENARSCPLSTVPSLTSILLSTSFRGPSVVAGQKDGYTDSLRQINHTPVPGPGIYRSPDVAKT
jgi:hypothetical protein